MFKKLPLENCPFCKKVCDETHWCRKSDLLKKFLKKKIKIIQS